MKKKQNSSLTTRFLWPDVIRIVAIYLVLSIHTNIQGGAPSLGFISVPLFVMLSGALLLGKQESYQTFFKKRCLKIVIPWIAWTVIYLFVDYQFLHKSKEDILSIHFLFQTFMSNLWFLPLIFSLYLITPLLRIFVQHAKQKDLLYIIVVWFFFLSVLPLLTASVVFPHWEPSIVFTTIQYSGYFLLGYFLIKKKLPPVSLWKMVGLLVIGLVFVVFSSGFLDPRTVIASVAIFIFLVGLSNRVDSSLNLKFKTLITQLSKASFGIYLVHQLIIDFFGKEIILFLQNFHLELLITAIIFIFSSLIVIIIQRIPLLKYLVP